MAGVSDREFGGSEGGSEVFSGSESDSATSDDSLGGVVLDWVQRYYTPALVGFGTLGNCLSVIVFFSTKLRKLSSSYYLSALAISDTGYLFCTFLSWLNVADIDLFNKPGICEFSIYLTQVILDPSFKENALS
ncbi:hypothetical protein GE061_004026 [Apolygus lucorum]|uniref:G-protein coupled receptors family 1 profile domain-containing protein n=1 Tax=Apolygus lucorum TaxID=248454 RepID=A0A8S9WY77_APOLU|nr:hypothetical protein GE061_004026 [Apolygus lucorum]